MSNPGHSSRSRRGFTLLEIMIVVVIIGLLAAIAIPAFTRARVRSQLTSLANDFRVFAGAFQQYALEYGAFPANAAAGQLPPSMDGLIKPQHFTARTPVGGQYDWISNSFIGGRYAVMVVGHSLTPDQIQAFDETYDDGDLSTGVVAEVGGRIVYFVDR